MATETEAECLLRSGALYRQRVGLVVNGQPLVFVGVKRGAFSIYEGDEPIYHFDLEGRWQRAYIDGTHYRKALDGSIDAIERPRVEGAMVLSRRRLSFAEAADLDETIRQVALGWFERIGDGSVRVINPTNATLLETETLRELFGRASGWDSAAWFSYRERYLATYEPPDFLPPDDHRSVVLQATLGDRAFSGTGDDACAWRTPDEFRAHCRSVKSLLGRRLAQNRDVYLGGSSAVRGPIQAYFEVANEEFPIVGTRDAMRTLPADEPELGSINLFLDDFRPGLPGSETWKRLKTLHLGRVNLGVVTADDSLRKALGLGGMADDVAGIVRELKTQETDLALIVHLGVGGPEHVERTVAWTESLELTRRDFVYLIDARESGLRCVDAWSPDESEHQREAFKERLTPLRKANGVKIVPYSVEKQWN